MEGDRRRRRRRRLDSQGPEWLRRGGPAAAGRRRARGDGQAVQRFAQLGQGRRPHLRPYGGGRHPSEPAPGARRRAHQAALLVRPRRHADEGTGRRPRHLEHLSIGLRWRESDADHLHRGSGYHAGLGAQRGRDRLCLLAERLLRHHRPVDGVRDARRRNRPRDRSRRRTTCLRGRQTARRSLSCRAGTATRRSTT